MAAKSPAKSVTEKTEEADHVLHAENGWGKIIRNSRSIGTIRRAYYRLLTYCNFEWPKDYYVSLVSLLGTAP